MIEIPLTRGFVALVDDEDAPLAEFRWRALSTHGKTYAVRSTGGKTLLLHREVLRPVGGLQVDHVDGNGLDCRRSNLRAATHGQNQHNRGRKKNSVSGFKGVVFKGPGRRGGADRERPWQARIMTNRKIHYIGNFSTAAEAARAYDQVARKSHGEFANTNFK